MAKEATGVKNLRKEKGMSIKLTKEQLKQIVLEELEEIRTDGRGFGAARWQPKHCLQKVLHQNQKVSEHA